MSSSWQIDPDTIQNYTAGKYSFDLASGENGVANPADSTCRYVIRQNNQVVSSFTIKSGRYHPSTIYPNWVRQGDSNTYNCRGLSTYCPYNP